MLKWDAAMEVRAVPPPPRKNVLSTDRTFFLRGGGGIRTPPFACPEAGYPSSPLNLKCTEACIQAELTAPQVT